MDLGYWWENVWAVSAPYYGGQRGKNKVLIEEDEEEPRPNFLWGPAGIQKLFFIVQDLPHNEVAALRFS